MEINVISLLITGGYVMLSTCIVLFTLSKILHPGKYTLLGGILTTLILVALFVLFHITVTVPSLQTVSSILQHLRTAAFLSLFFLFCLTTKATLSQKLQTYFFIGVATFLAETIMSFVYLYIFNISGAESFVIDSKIRIVAYTLNIFLYIIACICTYLYCKRKSLIHSTKVLLYFGIIFMLLCISGTLSTTAIITINNGFTKITFTICLISTMFSILIMYWIFIYTNKQERIKEQFLWLQKMQSAEADYYAELQNKTEEIRQMRHDIKDQLFSVKALLAENSAQSICAAEKIVENLENKLGSTALPIYTENRIANTVLAAKLKAAAQADISTDVSVHIPQSLERIDAADLSCVLINLLNNALEACANLPADMPKHLLCKAGVKGNYLIIKVCNPYDKIDIGKNGKIKTTKADTQNHGLGLLLLENIAEKYDGALQIDTADRQFTATVSLKISE